MTKVVTREDRVLRVGKMCCACIRNIACHRAGLERNMDRFGTSFWRDAHANFLYIAVIEWDKVFGDKKAEQYWPKVISEPYWFFDDLLSATGMTIDQYNSHVCEVRRFRNKFLAHLDDKFLDPPDDKPRPRYPELEAMLQSASLLYDYLYEHDGKGVFPWDAVESAETLYGLMYAEALETYSVPDEQVVS